MLSRPYTAEEARIIVQEMADTLAMKLFEKKLVTDQIVLHIGYDIKNLKDPVCREYFHGEIKTDHYGRLVPKHAHGTENLEFYSSSARHLTDAAKKLYDRITDQFLFVRRITLCANHVIKEDAAEKEQEYEQLSLFSAGFSEDALASPEKELRKKILEREKNIQKAISEIHKKYGKNALVKGIDLLEGATKTARNAQIGGHKK